MKALERMRRYCGMKQKIQTKGIYYANKTDYRLDNFRKIVYTIVKFQGRFIL